MGLLDFLSKAVDALPTVMEFLDKYGGEQNSTSENDLTDPYELIEECDEYLQLLPKFTVDDVDQILSCLSGIDRRCLKLDRIDSNSDDSCLSEEVFRLSNEREKAVEAIEQKFKVLLDKLSEESKAENDPGKWQILNDQWFKYFNEQQRIQDHNLKFLEQIANQASDFVNG